MIPSSTELADDRPAEAVRSLRQSIELGGSHSHAAGGLIAALVASGNRAEAQVEFEALERLARAQYVPPFAFAAAHAAFGNMDQAFAALDRGIAEKDVLMAENFFEPLLDPLVEDPRYGRIAALIRGSTRADD